MTLSAVLQGHEAEVTQVSLQSGETCCAAFCASLVLLAGSGNNARYNGLQRLERAADCNKVREDVARLIYLFLGKHEVFSAFHC